MINVGSDKRYGESGRQNSHSARDNYPSKSHPSGYYFTWEIGRILHEYHIGYITEGVSPTRFRTAAKKHQKRRIV